VDPSDVLTPGEPAEHAGDGIHVHAGVGAGHVRVRGAVRGRAVAEVDVADVLSPGEPGEEPAVELDALRAGGAARVAPVHPADVLAPGPLVDGRDVAVGEGGAGERRRRENRETLHDVAPCVCGGLTVERLSTRRWGRD